MAGSGAQATGRRWLAATLILGSVAWASATLAASDRPTNPPAPQSDTPEALKAWAAQYVVPDDYLLMDAAEGWVYLLKPETVEPTAQGARAEVRGEFTRRERVRGVSGRSFADIWEFDCQGRRMRELQSDLYPQSNLQGRPTRMDSSKEGWASEADDVDRALIDGACRMAALLKEGDRAKVLPPPPEDLLDADVVSAWADKVIEPKGDKRIRVETGIVSLYSPKVERSEEGRPIVWVRNELSVLLNMDGGLTRSMRERDELDCAHHRVRRLEVEGYPGQNLTGPVVRTGEEAWSLLVAGEADTEVAEAVCADLEPETAAAPPTLQAPTDDEAAAWIRAFLNQNGYVNVGPVDEGLVLYGVGSITPTGKDEITVGVRRELWKPETAGDTTWRSSLWNWAVDCRDFRVKVLSSELFEQNNLKASLGVDDTADDWQALDPSSIGGVVARAACADRVLVDGVADLSLAVLPEPQDLNDAGVAQWIDVFIDPGEYVLASYDQNAAQFYSSEQIERLANEHIRVWTRAEMFKAVRLKDGSLVRSMRSLMEFDCAEHRSRMLAMEAYPGSNLQGPKTATSKPQDWAFPEPSSSLSILGTELCTAKAAADAEDGADGPVAPTASRKTL